LNVLFSIDKVYGAGKENGNTIVQWEVPQGENDDWCFVDQDEGYYSILNRWSGKVLAVPSGTLTPSTQLVQWDFANIADRLWKLEPVCATLPTDRHFNILAKHSNMAVNVDHISTANGATIMQFPIDLGKNDNWRLQSAGLGYYNIIAEHSQKAINGEIRLTILDCI
jgi:endoglucanase